MGRVLSVDLRIDKATGDLVTLANNDFALIDGLELIEQRMRIRIKTPIGTFPGDLTLGSSLGHVMRLQVAMQLAQLPLTIKEALAPMDDILVHDVDCWVDDDPRAIRFNVTYSIVSDGVVGDQVQLLDSLVVNQ